MILVDSSVWISNLRGYRTRATLKLAEAAAREKLLVGDLVLLEVLQGARDDAHAARIEFDLQQHSLVTLLDPALAPQVARNFRRLRERRITIRKTIDLIIGTYCIEHGHALLHEDSDFAPMEAYLGLRVV